MSLNKATVRKLLTQKLNHDNFHVNNYSQKRLDATGMMGEHFTLMCNIKEKLSSDSEKHTFFVKKKPQRSEHFGEEICDRIYHKEVATLMMFQTFNLPTLNTLYPKCFHIDDQHLVFEDLLVEGYQSLTTQRVATEQEIIVILKTLAGMHAASIAYEEQETAKSPNQKLYRLNHEFPKAFDEIYFDVTNSCIADYHYALFKGLHTAINTFNLPEVLKNGKLLKYELNQFKDLLNQKDIEPSKKYRNVMCHSDLWPGNIFMKYDVDGKPQHAKIIDFQIERYLPPAFDVLQYLLYNTSRDYRQKHMLKLKKTYYEFFSDCLQEYGVNPIEVYTFEEFLDSFKEIEILPIYLALHVVPMCYNSELYLNVLAHSSDFKLIVMKDRSPLFRDFSSNDYCMGRIKDCLLDMVEYFENN